MSSQNIKRRSTCLMGSNEIFSSCNEILQSFSLQHWRSLAAALQQQTGHAAPKHMFNGKQWDFQQLQGYSDVLRCSARPLVWWEAMRSSATARIFWCPFVCSAERALLQRCCSSKLDLQRRNSCLMGSNEIFSSCKDIHCLWLIECISGTLVHCLMVVKVWNLDRNLTWGLLLKVQNCACLIHWQTNKNASFRSKPFSLQYYMTLAAQTNTRHVS